MENRNSRIGIATRSLACSIRTILNFSVLLLAMAGCGAPGEPTAPSPPIPAAITDVSVRQSGDGAQLTFSMPGKTIRGERLTEPPAIEILRGTMNAPGAADPKSFHVVATIPGAVIGKYLSDDHVHIVDAIPPEETRTHPGATLAYRVRTRASKKRASPDSNVVFVRMFPVPQRIASLEAKVTEALIALSWAPPTQTSAGTALAVPPEQHIYRGEIDTRTYEAATRDLSLAKWISPSVLLTRTNAGAYNDTQFEFGKTYVYIVRSAITAEGNELESDASDPLVLTTVDTFPPATPQDVVATVASPETGSPEVDLSWSINAEADLAGYRVYRSDTDHETDRGQLVAPDLLLSPAYRDTSVAPDHRYWYRVTAVDRAGNESAPSAPVPADVAQHSL
jgi:hypothetical protein